MSRRRFQRKSGVIEFLDTSLLSLDPAALDATADVPETIGKVGDILAERVEDLAIAEGEWETWKAARADELTRPPPQPGPGEERQKAAPEWKAKLLVAAAPQYGLHAAKIARIRGDIEFLRMFHYGLRAKMELVGAFTRLRCAEWKATDFEGAPYSAREPGRQSLTERYRARQQTKKEGGS